RCAVVDIKTGLQGFKGKAFGLSWRRLGDCRSATGSGNRMKIYRVDVGALNSVFHVNRNGIVDTDANKRTGYGIVKCPIAIAAALTQFAFHLGSNQIHYDMPGLALTYRFTNLIGILG